MTSTFAYEDLEVLRNRTFDEIAVGDRASALEVASMNAPARCDALRGAGVALKGGMSHE